MRFYTQEDVQLAGLPDFLFIKVSLDHHILRVTLNRPEKRNAFNNLMAEEIVFVLAYAHYNAVVRCVVFDAAGPVFCAGADLTAFQESSSFVHESSLPKIREEARLGDAFQEVHKPCIAVVQGPVLAGGFLIICGCTFVLSTPGATFSLPEVKRGLWPMQVMASLLQIVPPRKALEMAVTAGTYTAEEALSSGLITSIAEEEQIVAQANLLAQQICENAPLAIQSGLKAFNTLGDVPRAEQHAFLKAQLDLLLQSRDAAEGIQAFREKRKPVWLAK